jgi:hypothetical protein
MTAPNSPLETAHDAILDAAAALAEVHPATGLEDRA